MPDLINVFFKWWKLIFGMTIAATGLAILIAVLLPKKYLSTVTALPVNGVLNDKARIFNPNIESLYSEYGTSDDLDKMEGTAVLDTIFIATAKKFNLAGHFKIKNTDAPDYEAAMQLKDDSKISKSEYGELQIKVWDVNAKLAAEIANQLLEQLQEIHQHLQAKNNELVLQKLRDGLSEKETQLLQIKDSLQTVSSPKADLLSLKKINLAEQIQEYHKIIDQYDLALKTNAPRLLVVEYARASVKPDKPKILQTGVLTLISAFLFSYLLAIVLESRKSNL